LPLPVDSNSNLARAPGDEIAGSATVGDDDDVSSGAGADAKSAVVLIAMAGIAVVWDCDRRNHSGYARSRFSLAGRSEDAKGIALPPDSGLRAAEVGAGPRGMERLQSLPWQRDKAVLTGKKEDMPAMQVLSQV
jgi:hypothetical protein